MLIVGQKERCGDWARDRIGVQSWGAWYEALGWEKDGELQAVVVFENWSGPDISLHIAAMPGKRWLRREFMRAGFRYAFIQLGVRRITCPIPAMNFAAARFAVKFGFTLEGVKQHGWWNDDMMIFGLKKAECKYL